MKHLEIFKEIDAKIHAMCDAALREGGVSMLPAINQLANALTQIVNYQSPDCQPDCQSSCQDSCQSPAR